jgi:hypothetical protein
MSFKLENDENCLHREGDSGLVVLYGGKNTALVGRNGGIARNNDTENVSLHGDTKGERGNIEEEEILGLFRGLSGEDSCLNGGTICNCLIRVDRFVQLTTAEELRDECLDFGDTSGTTNEDDVVNLFKGQNSNLTRPTGITLSRDILASLSTLSTGSIVDLNMAALISSKRARVMVAEKSSPCKQVNTRP